MTQAVFAKALKVGRAGLSKWELDQRVPDAATIIDACRLLNIPSSQLLGLEEGEGEPFHERLRCLFKAEGYERALNILGVGPEALEAVLTGKLLIPSKTLERMMRAYAVSTQWLKTGEPAAWAPSLTTSLQERLKYFRVCVGMPSSHPMVESFEKSEDFAHVELEAGLDFEGMLKGVIAMETGIDMKAFPFNIAWIKDGHM
jgi:transcriptional regulator with XRE-family HTH domain